jgi:hypothetical protein
VVFVFSILILIINIDEARGPTDPEPSQIESSNLMSPSTWTLRIALLLALAPAAALAQEDFDETLAPVALEHGKAATADASPVDPGAVEAEIGYAPTRNDRGGSSGFDVADEGHQHSLIGTVTYGVAPDVDANIGFAFGSVYDAAHQHEDGSAPTRGSGLGDVAFGARWRFLNLPERALEMAFTAGAVAPLGTEHRSSEIGLSQEFWSARGAFVATKDLGRATMNGELALEAPISGDAGGLRSVFQANAAFGVHVLPWLQPEVELNYESSFGIRSQLLAATAGVVAPFGAGHRVVVAIQHGLWGQDTTRSTGALLAFKTAL